ncbi:MAG: hydrogenase maturation protease [Phycisphaerales bacterium]|nr:hydrogenase maturation protease [Phycisphaerales bacterium]
MRPVGDRIPLLILGLGNELMRDDGAGVHLARRLMPDPPHGAVVLDLGTAVLDALPFLERAEVVIALDAVRGTDPPGSLYRFELHSELAAAAPPSERVPSGALAVERAPDFPAHAERVGGKGGGPRAEPPPQGAPPMSLHEVELAAALRLLPPHRRPAVTVLGVEPARVDVGLDLTEVVSASLPRLAALVQAEADRLLQVGGPAEA